MGMLQLAGMVSGAGKGIQRGLEQMQTTMSQMQLLGIRDEMERARMRETWGHDEGMLQKKHALDVEKIGLEQSGREKIVGLQGQQESEHIAQRGAQQEKLTGIEQSGAMERLKTQNQFSAEQKDREFQDDLKKLYIKRGWDVEDAERKAKDELTKFKREEAAKLKERQHMTGERITLKSMELQEAQARGRSTRADYHDQDAQGKVIESRIKRLMDEFNNVMTTDERKAQIQKEIARLERQQDELTGLPSSQPSRPAYKFPQ